MEPLIEKITANEEIIAIVVRGGFKPEGVNFLTPENFPLQMGVSSYKKGDILKTHTHLQRKRIIKNTQEMVYVQNGKIEIYFYNSNGKLIRTRILEGGDTVFFAAGGHGWKTLEDSKIIEVKQGPYLGLKQDKIYLKDPPLNKNQKNK